MDLGPEWHGFNFIQQQGAAMGIFKFTNSGLFGIGEGPGLVSEKFTFNYTLGNSATVDSNEVFCPSLTVFMQ